MVFKRAHKTELDIVPDTGEQEISQYAAQSDTPRFTN